VGQLPQPYQNILSNGVTVAFPSLNLDAVQVAPHGSVGLIQGLDKCA
jgi:hypothetical protein